MAHRLHHPLAPFRGGRGCRASWRQSNTTASAPGVRAGSLARSRPAARAGRHPGVNTTRGARPDGPARIGASAPTRPPVTPARSAHNRRGNRMPKTSDARHGAYRRALRSKLLQSQPQSNQQAARGKGKPVRHSRAAGPYRGMNEDRFPESCIDSRLYSRYASVGPGACRSSGFSLGCEWKKARPDPNSPCI